MNLVPPEVLRGDINCLPNATQWLPLCFSGGVQFKALELGDEVGVCSLYSSSKSGLRTGSEEAVSIRDPLVLDLLHLDIWLNVNFEGNGSGLTQANPFGIDSKLICNFSALAIST